MTTVTAMMKRIIYMVFAIAILMESTQVVAFTTSHAISGRTHPTITFQSENTISQFYKYSFQKTLKPHPTCISSKRSTSTDKKEGVTSRLISNLAIIALKLRLAKHSGVACDVSASSSNILLKATVGPVTVQGRNWESPLGLSCRNLKATVNVCTLDWNSVVKRRKLKLVEPAVGEALIALGAKDFGNFVTHPLLLKQVPQVSIPRTNLAEVGEGEKQPFAFSKEGVYIDAKGEGGSVYFFGTVAGQRWKCNLQRGTQGGVADIQVEHHSTLDDSAHQLTKEDLDAMALELTMVTSAFFNDLVFELDGTFLSFRDMRFHRRIAKGTNEVDSNVLMALSIVVKKFPSPGLEF